MGKKTMAKAYLVALLALCLVSVAVAQNPEPQKCYIFNSCSSCLVFKECGWCASTGVCMNGNNLAPLTGNCTVWDYGICSGEPCSSYSNCYSCSRDPFCGWGADTFQCMSGNFAGPTGGACPAEAYSYQSCSLQGPIPAMVNAYGKSGYQ